jgi:hypothetical protein
MVDDNHDLKIGKKSEEIVDGDQNGITDKKKYCLV